MLSVPQEAPCWSGEVLSVLQEVPCWRGEGLSERKMPACWRGLAFVYEKGTDPDSGSPDLRRNRSQAAKVGDFRHCGGFRLHYRASHHWRRCLGEFRCGGSQFHYRASGFGIPSYSERSSGAPTVQPQASPGHRPGYRARKDKALKGRHQRTSSPSGPTPLQGWRRWAKQSQGDALGWLVFEPSALSRVFMRKAVAAPTQETFVPLETRKSARKVCFGRSCRSRIWASIAASSAGLSAPDQ